MVEINHPNANAQESHIKTLAGLILNHKNAKSIQITIPITVVVIYHLYEKVIIPITSKLINKIHHASQSKPSVIFIAFTMATVKIKVTGR